MSRADELWEKYSYDGWIGPTAFKAALAIAVNEVLELAARECEKNMMATGVPMILLTKAAAIRGLKVK